ncbi:MAG: toxin-antitoxin system HicB family antitoxin [Rubrobacteraceae bacterium]
MSPTGIRETAEEKAYSGKVNLRMPKSLHRDLAKRAKDEGVSLNQLMAVILARAVGKVGSREEKGIDHGPLIS